MGYLFVLMGKSATGKDSVFRELLRGEEGLRRALIHTTRPRRKDEKEGVEYKFSSIEDLRRYEAEGRLIESRSFYTIRGEWHYFTVDDGSIKLSEHDYILINTLAGYEKTRDYFGRDKVVPLYLEVPDGERLYRALKREDREAKPDYDELCRRFLADNRDFSEENLMKAGIPSGNRFKNQDFSSCVEEVRSFLRRGIHGY